MGFFGQLGTLLDEDVDALSTILLLCIGVTPSLPCSSVFLVVVAARISLLSLSSVPPSLEVHGTTGTQLECMEPSDLFFSQSSKLGQNRRWSSTKPQQIAFVASFGKNALEKTTNVVAVWI